MLFEDYVMFMRNRGSDENEIQKFIRSYEELEEMSASGRFVITNRTASGTYKSTSTIIYAMEHNCYLVVGNTSDLEAARRYGAEIGEVLGRQLKVMCLTDGEAIKKMKGPFVLDEIKEGMGIGRKELSELSAKGITGYVNQNVLLKDVYEL